jgi:cellulose synthase/poly-beta-1,6-N-acetylglucosamine synthase-like glycosyltransferase
MQVSVIIPTRNRPDRLADALCGVADQRFDGQSKKLGNDHGIAVDDIVDRFSGRLTVRLPDQPAERGPSAARNVGLRVAEGEFVAFLDDDDVWAPNHLAVTVGRLRAGADLVYVDTPIARTRVTGSTIASAEVLVRLDFPNDRGLLEVTNHIAPSAVVCRSPRAVDAYFDTELEVIEDWDMWLQLINRCGYRVAHHPEATMALHRIPGGASLTIPTAADVKALRGFEEHWERVCARWPASTPRTARARSYIPLLFRLAYQMIEQGRALDHHYYERTLRVLYGALGDPAPSPEQVEAGLIAALHGR